MRDVFSVLSPQAATPELTQAKLVMSGQAYMGTGQIDDAENQFRAALESAPNLADAKLGLARIEALRNRTDEARRSVEEVLRTSPDNLEALLLSADIAFAGQRADDALASLNRAAALAPDNPRVLLPRARVRLQTGSIDEAEKDVSRVLERAPKRRDGKVHEGVDPASAGRRQCRPRDLPADRGSAGGLYPRLAARRPDQVQYRPVRPGRGVDEPVPGGGARPCAGAPDAGGDPTALQ